MPEILRVGGRQYNWNSSLTRIDGAIWQGLTSVDWSQKLDVETVYSQTQDGVPLGDTGGQFSVESITIKMLWEYAERLKQYLAFTAPGSNGERGAIGTYGLTKFTFQMSVTEPLIPGAFPIQLDAGPCRLITEKNTTEQGTGKLELEMGLWCQQLTVNGISLYNIAPPSL